MTSEFSMEAELLESSSNESQSSSTTTSRHSTPRFNTSRTPPVRKSKNDLANDVLVSVGEHFKKPREPKQEDRFDIFGKNVASKLREVENNNKLQRILAEKQINDVLFDAEMGNLTSYCKTDNQRPTEFVDDDLECYSVRNVSISSFVENFQP